MMTNPPQSPKLPLPSRESPTENLEDHANSDSTAPPEKGSLFASPTKPPSNEESDAVTTSHLPPYAKEVGDTFVNPISLLQLFGGAHAPRSTNLPSASPPSSTQHRPAATPTAASSSDDEFFAAKKQGKGKRSGRVEDIVTQRPYVKEINVSDVLLGRGERSNRHKGNILFLKEKYRFQPRFLQAQTNKEKASIAQEFVNFMASERGSRFLALDEVNRKWYLADDERVLEKAKQVLRKVLTPEQRRAQEEWHAALGS